MPLPLIPIAIFSGGAYVATKISDFFGDDNETQQEGFLPNILPNAGTTTKIAILAGASFLAYKIYKGVK